MSDEKQEFIKLYGDTKVVFSWYYKFTFNYKGTLDDGRTVIVSVGGNADDIYRFDVSAETPETIASLDPYAGNVQDQDGAVVEEFYDY